jgi:uncharacterized DUF497 family protein
MELTFEWDPRKAAANVRKHGVSFEQAIAVFGDSLARIFDDPDYSNEPRELIVGHCTRQLLLVVCFVQRGDRIRIFSARRATRRERRDYEEGTSQT